jgi:hypothetical protein
MGITFQDITSNITMMIMMIMATALDQYSLELEAGGAVEAGVVEAGITEEVGMVVEAGMEAVDTVVDIVNKQG